MLVALTPTNKGNRCHLRLRRATAARSCDGGGPAPTKATANRPMLLAQGTTSDRSGFVPSSVRRLSSRTGPAPVVGGREARDLRSLTGTCQYGTAPPAASVLSASMPRFAAPPLRHPAYAAAPLTTAGLRSGSPVRSALRLVEDSSPPLRLPYVWSLRPASSRRHSSAASSLRASLRRDASMRPAFQTNAEHPARRLALSPSHRIPVAPQSLRSRRSADASIHLLLGLLNPESRA